ncbi:hypothetical protein K438DRAFT_1771859 [Mycena galopus ATCC 62051]|nr:hypothetical protein K438DRAFT_1771859 [Mycena galopus ATCC 62051]
MFSKFFSTAVLCLALVHGVMSAGPVGRRSNLANIAGHPWDQPCPKDQLCCGAEIDHMQLKHCEWTVPKAARRRPVLSDPAARLKGRLSKEGNPTHCEFSLYRSC